MNQIFDYSYKRLEEIEKKPLNKEISAVLV